MSTLNHKKLALISAPAGFGKTTLVTHWLRISNFEQQNMGIGWLSLEENDSSPLVFWSYFLAGLKKIDPVIGQAAQVALLSQSLEMESFLISLINDLASIDRQVFFVLDDYYRIESPEIHQALDFLIQHIPHTFHLIILTREDPPLALSRLRARDQVVEIRAADLRFSEKEADLFINEVLGLDLESGDIQSLLNRTEGWVTGLRLAGISLRNEPYRHEFVKAFSASHRYLTDYLMDEVYFRLDDSLKEFVILTSFLYRFNIELCATVTSNPESAKLIQRLEHSNLFLVPLNNDHSWYRYHHLFREFMHLRLLETQASLIPELYQRAVKWHIEQELYHEALQYAVASKNFEKSADILENLAPEILTSQGSAALINWLESLPSTVVDKHPALIISHAWALTYEGNIDEAEKNLEKTSLLIDDDTITFKYSQQELTTMRGYINALRAHHLFFKGKTKECMAFSEQALNGLPPEEYAIRAQTAAFLGSGYRYLGQNQTALKLYSQAIEICEKTANVNMATISYGSLAELYLELGLLRKAMQTYQLMLEFAEKHAGRKDTPYSGFTYIAMGRALHEWNHLDDARQSLEKGISLCREWRQAQTLAIGIIELALLEKDLGNYDAARKHLQEARQITSLSGSQWGTNMVDAFEARLDLARGNLNAAVQWADKSGISTEDDPAFERSVEYFSYIRVLIAQKKEKDALVLLEKIQQRDQATGKNGRVLEALIWKARGCLGLGDRQRALEHLKEAFSISNTENYIYSYLDAGKELASVIQEMPASVYRDKLLAAFIQQTNQTMPLISQDRDLTEDLNEREIDVLRGMAAGLSNQEIGENLYLSVNTIRWYASQIYMKLGVKSRSAAVARAVELGILK
jgi:LuxR family maltose regulon positive regulatory protein